MTKRTKKHSTAIRRNTELHALVFGQIAAEQERESLATYRTYLRAQREAVIGYNNTSTIGRNLT